MSRPTLSARLARKLILMSADPDFSARARAALPERWDLVETTDLSPLGDFASVLLHRFILIDLDARAVFDPIAVLRQVRMEMMLNVPIFCFGGDARRRDDARLSRADRCFDRDELESVLPALCEQFGWGG